MIIGRSSEGIKQTLNLLKEIRKEHYREVLEEFPYSNQQDKKAMKQALKDIRMFSEK